ncbi:hypothetical protein BZA77DRAFT_274802 [Pyronema omphalodes]|nr:hypothetical protein BZA77DRAFT_274802 [Pyronema omphalodes]
MFRTTEINGISLDATGLVALADLATIAQRTAIVGSASMLDALVLAPGIHRHQTASEINGGEQPATAALTTGYVFRVENQATVHYLRSIGITGHLVTVKVEKETKVKFSEIKPGKAREFFVSRYCFKGGLLTSLLYMICPVLTILAFFFLLYIRDSWGIGSLMALIAARLSNVIVIRQRSKAGWKGKSEPGVYGHLLVLISQDRWIRINGLVDDLKQVTSGQWLKDTSSGQSFIAAVATLIVYVTAAFSGNATRFGSVTILCLLLFSASLLGLSNKVRRTFHMHGCVLKVDGEPKRYERRLDLAQELIKEFKRSDWAVGLGMIRPDDVDGDGYGPKNKPEDKDKAVKEKGRKIVL